jgi:hypothetical protein
MIAHDEISSRIKRMNASEQRKYCHSDKSGGQEASRLTLRANGGGAMRMFLEARQNRLVAHGR